MPASPLPESEHRRLLEFVAAHGPARAALAAHLGVSENTTESRIKAAGRERFRDAAASWKARMRAQREVAPHTTPAPRAYDDGTSRLYELRRGKAALRVDLAKLRDELLADIRGHCRAAGTPHVPPPDGLLHVVSPADLHVGKLSWAPETGEDFDSAIASARLREVTAKLLAHAGRYPVAEHLLVVGNDLLQVDNLMSTTTAGTFQDTDSRYRKMFRLAVQLMREVIEQLAESARVRVLTVPGNHDALASFHVGEVLGAVFHAHRRVTVSPDLRPRLYHRHGAVLLGFCHGNDEKHADLPLIMAQENPEDWGRTSYREFLVAHLHKKRERVFNAGDSYQGVRVVVLQSLTGTDAWHAKKGYIGEPKASESRLYDRADGLVAAFTARATVG